MKGSGCSIEFVSTAMEIFIRNSSSVTRISVFVVSCTCIREFRFRLSLLYLAENPPVWCIRPKRRPRR